MFKTIVTKQSYKYIKMIYYWAPGKAVGIGSSPQMYVMYYNVDIFKKAGINPPSTDAKDAWTWDKF